MFAGGSGVVRGMQSPKFCKEPHCIKSTRANMSTVQEGAFGLIAAIHVYAAAERKG